jgi:hypothetical protein
MRMGDKIQEVAAKIPISHKPESWDWFERMDVLFTHPVKCKA